MVFCLYYKRQAEEPRQHRFFGLHTENFNPEELHWGKSLTMIYQVLLKEEVIALKDELEKGLPGTAKIFYILRNFLCGLLDGFEVIVDKWPEWTCIILRATDTDRAPAYFKHYYICHARSVSALKFFMQRPGVIDWTSEATFTGVPTDLVPFLKDYCRKQNGQLKNVQSRFMYAWTKAEPPQEPDVPEGLQLTTLQDHHVHILRQDWKDLKSDSGLDTYFKSVVHNFDNSALTDKNGKLLAYICMQFNGSMAMLSGNTENQGKGYGQIVLSDLTRKLLEKKEIAYGFIPTKDSNIINITQIMGYTWVPQGNMAWFRFEKLPSVKSATTNGSRVLEHSHSQEDGVGNCMFINAIPLVVREMTDHQPPNKVSIS
ncbi:glycine N-acyltransferase-like isoform X2 [Haliotis cracherodii]|uniref:glycine N-acyltransferase-like isoform X2 n=1 Tax=Haliotis cracherodii TaxID=6455 RepID=UPI0039E9829C